MELITIQNIFQEENYIKKIVNEYIEENRSFKKNDLIPYIRSRNSKTGQNLNSLAISLILKKLIKNKLFIEGSKLSKETLLSDSKRKNIYDLIIKNPGISLKLIFIKLNISKHIIEWHINQLLKFNLIRREKIDNHFIFFDYDMDFEIAKATYLRFHNRTKIIIDYLKDNDYGVPKTKISTDLKIHHNTIKKFLIQLEKSKIIIKKKISNKILYFYN